MRNGDKSDRMNTILRLVAERVISAQEELLALLKDEGFNVTQATLSRDIKALQIVKVPNGRGGYRYTPNPTPLSPARTVQGHSGVISVDISGQICVVKTLPGYASVTAAALDDANLPFVMGTIAGDDTVMLALRKEVVDDEVLQAISSILPDFDARLSAVK